MPTIIRWPGLIEAGSTSDALISQVDFMATIAAAFGAEIPAGQALDSFTLLPYLKGESAPTRTRMVHNTYAHQYALRDGDWLLIDAESGYAGKRWHPPESWDKKHDYPADEEHPAELYNLKQDIGQRHNLAIKPPDRVKQMQALLQEIRSSRYPKL